jgi:hypothetical protein
MAHKLANLHTMTTQTTPTRAICDNGEPIKSNITQLSGPLPLYHHYDGQTNPQPAFIEIEAGEVTFDWNAEIGSAIPMSVHHRRALRLPIPNHLSLAGYQSLFEDITPALREIIAGHTLHWDGNNLAGRLTEEAQAAFDGLEYQSITGEWDNYHCDEQALADLSDS